MYSVRLFIHTTIFDQKRNSKINDRTDKRKLGELKMSEMGQELIKAMQELVDFSKGKIDLRTSEYNILPVCEKISVDDIKATREKLNMSQGVFAIVLGVSKKTVESWEVGRYAPDGAARRLISILQMDPAFPEKYGIVQKALSVK